MVQSAGCRMDGRTPTMANGAVTGAVAGALFLWLVQQYTAVSFLLYASIGILGTFVIGWMASMLFEKDPKSSQGLTIYKP